jgi:hypothetical protein
LQGPEIERIERAMEVVPSGNHGILVKIVYEMVLELNVLKTLDVVHWELLKLGCWC